VARRTLTNDEKRKLYRLYSEGIPMSRLVAQFGFSAPTLRAEVQKHGLEPGMPISEGEIDCILQEGAYAPAPQPNPFGDNEQLAVIGENMTAKINCLIEVAQTATTAEGIVNALNTTIAIKQLFEVLQNPPPVEGWRDVEKLVKIARDAFGMNEKDKKQSKGIDYRMVSAKKQEGVILDI
jgi:transposase-like protein